MFNFICSSGQCMIQGSPPRSNSFDNSALDVKHALRLVSKETATTGVLSWSGPWAAMVEPKRSFWWGQCTGTPSISKLPELRGGARSFQRGGLTCTGVIWTHSLFHHSMVGNCQMCRQAKDSLSANTIVWSNSLQSSSYL